MAGPDPARDSVACATTAAAAGQEAELLTGIEWPAVAQADRAGQRVTSVPDITRLLARGKPGGRAEAARRLAEANKLLDEVSNMLGELRRELMGGIRR
jgi:hypothetical protein